MAKVDNLRVGDTLRTSGSNITVAPISYPRPVAEVAITPRSHHDEEKLSTALHRIEEEDPTIRVERRSDTGETILAGLGDTHLDVTVARIHRKFGVEVDTSLPVIPYRETITTSAQAEGKHKKQSGAVVSSGLPWSSSLRCPGDRDTNTSTRSKADRFRDSSFPPSTRASRKL